MPQIEELSQQPIAQLRARFLDACEPVPRLLLEQLELDERRTARQLANQLRARQHAQLAEGQRLRHLLKFENELWAQGYALIAGVDEAGVGPLAGPVVAGAVILPGGYKLRALDDSKKLDEITRAKLAAQIKADAVAWATGSAAVAEIDSLNIYHGSLLAMQRAVSALPTAPDFILVDARRIPDCSTPQRGIVRGDQLSASIAAASIIAKTTRDELMIELDRQYPGYGLAAHKGYPTTQHRQALRRLGAAPIHRRSFRPVREALGIEFTQASLLDAAP